MKLGQAQDETGKRFFASELLEEISSGLLWNGSPIFTQSNFNVGAGISGNGTQETPFSWKGFQFLNASGIVQSETIKGIKASTGMLNSISDGILTISVDLSNYSGTSVSIAGNSSKLVLNGLWSLQDGNSVKFAAENKTTAYFYSGDVNTEYPSLKAKSNSSGSEREFLLLDSSGKIPSSAKSIPTSSTLGEVIVDGGNISVDSTGKIAWTGFSAQNSSGSSLGTTVKTIKAGNNVSFSVSGNILTISSEGTPITVDQTLDTQSTNPVQNSVITTELNKKITNPSGAQSGQFLSWNGTSFVWATPSGGSSITIDSTLSDSSTNPVQNKVIKEELDKKITNPAGATAGQVLGWTGASFAWITPSSGSGSGADINTIKTAFLAITKIILQKPESDEELYPKVIASQTADFSNPITIDPSANSVHRMLFNVFNGEIWISFPSDSGLGTPFDNMEVSVNAFAFSALTLPFYVKYCWKTSDGTESNYKSIIFPAVQTSSPKPSEESYQDILTITRPASDDALFPFIEASENEDFSDSIVVNTYENHSDANFLKVFTGSEWITCPSDGLGTPFDEMPVSVSMIPFVSLRKPFYVRYCWITSDGAYGNYKSTIYPSTSIETNQLSNLSERISDIENAIGSFETQANNIIGESE